MSAPYRSWIEVSRRQIAANFQAVRHLAGADVEVCPVVKADAYRHGAVEVSRTLVDEGARWLAVSSMEEGLSLRQAGVTARILVMAEFLPGEREALLRDNLTPVIHSLDDLRAFDQLAARRAVMADYHLKVDSGMGRLGVLAPAGEIARAVREARNVRIEGLMTHFASAADYTGMQTDIQIEVFEAMLNSLAAQGIAAPLIHLSSTIALAYGRPARMANDGSARTRALRLRLAGPRAYGRQRTCSGVGRATGTGVESRHRAGEGCAGRRAHRLWRNVSGRAPHAPGHPGGRLCRRYPAPAGQQG